MSHGHERGDTAEHDELTSLIPWYVNGTLGESDRLRLDAQLQTCASCREDLEIERRIHRSVSADPAVNYMPGASLRRLHARLDALAGAGPASGAAPAPRARRRLPTPGWRAACLVAVAIVCGSWGAWAWRSSGGSPARYYTVTAPQGRAHDEVIRAVFSQAITLAELEAILHDARLRIVGGPTEAGVYSLAADSNRPVSLSLALLRQHPMVRFAEITQPDAARQGAP